MKIKVTVLAAAFAVLSGALPGAADIPGKLKKPILIARYAKGQNLYCFLSSGEKISFENHDTVEVYYYSEMATRIWVFVSGGNSPTGNRSGDCLLGEDTTCNFHGARSTEF